MTGPLLRAACGLGCGLALIAAITGWWFGQPLLWGGLALGGVVLYWPGAHLLWWGDVGPQDRWALAVAAGLSGLLIAATLVGLGRAARERRRAAGDGDGDFGAARWARPRDLRRGGLR